MNYVCSLEFNIFCGLTVIFSGSPAESCCSRQDTLIDYRRTVRYLLWVYVYCVFQIDLVNAHVILNAKSQSVSVSATI